jgi:hypothetical protein
MPKIAFVTEVDVSGFSIAISETASSIWSEATDEEPQHIDVSGIIALEVTSATPTPEPSPSPIPAEVLTITMPCSDDAVPMSPAAVERTPSPTPIPVPEVDLADDADSQGESDGESSDDDMLPRHQPTLVAASPDRSPTPIVSPSVLNHM